MNRRGYKIEHSRKESLVEFNKRNIIEASKELFKESSIDKTTIDEIAKKADYSKSTIYVYFKSKEEIFNNIVYEYFLILRDSLSDIVLQCDDFKERYYKICYMFVDFKIKYPMYFEMLSSKMSVNEKELKKNKVLKDIYTVGEEINSIIKNVLAHGIDKAIVRDNIKILETTFILQGAIFGIITIAFNKQEYLKLSLDIAREDFLKNAFDSLLLSLLKNKNGD